MSKRGFLFLSLIIIMSLVLGACGKSAKPGGSTGADVLRVGVDDTYPPMEYRDEKGNLVGYDIDVAKEVGKRLNREIEFVPTAWSAIFTGLSSGKYDCIISSLSITEERMKTIAYTRPYIANNQVIIVGIGNTDINSEKDLGNKIVAVQMGTTAEESCNEFMKTTPFKEFKKYEGMTQALNELKIGRVDAVVSDIVVGKYFVANDVESFKLVETTLPDEPIGIGFDKKNQELCDEVDRVLKEMLDDGTLKSISEKWFKDDMTKNIK
ncbi:MAG: transporter substrate-binding domain-containing protein [Acetivibrionales bacterium]|jgi:polar amino acid transport system substrate-binding protein